MAIIKYKGTDGEFKPLSNVLIKGIEVVQTTGTSTIEVMSQNAVTEIVTDISGTVSSHTANTDIHLTTGEKSELHTHNNKTALDSVTGSVGTMAYENASSYSSATQVNTALGGKSDTGHTHTSNEITAMTNYTSGVTISPISTTDSLNTAIGKLEHSLGGVKIVTITQSAYDALVQADTVDPTTLYVITD